MHTALITLALVACICGQTLRQAAQHTGVYAGAVRNYQHTTEPTYNQILNQEYSVITAENACKWAAIRPNQNTFSFTQCDTIANAAESASAAFRGHNLCWGQYNPGWLTSQSWTQAQLTQVLQNHITTVIQHYRGKAICWDVVNEAIADNPNPSSPFKQNVWYPTISNYVDVAFQAARQADPNVKLFYNDYGGEGLGAKSDAIYNMVKSMKSRNIPIDGVGLQMHVSTDYWPKAADISANIKRLGALGLEVHITEMDVSCPGNCNLQLQAQIYSEVLSACLQNRNICKSFQTWGFTDKYTWLGSDKHPLPFDENYNKKPAYNAILSNFTSGV